MLAFLEWAAVLSVGLFIFVLDKSDIPSCLPALSFLSLLKIYAALSAGDRSEAPRHLRHPHQTQTQPQPATANRVRVNNMYTKPGKVMEF